MKLVRVYEIRRRFIKKMNRELKPFIFWDGEGCRQFVCHSDGEVEIDFPTYYLAAQPVHA
jgi:hypothetical protein